MCLLAQVGSEVEKMKASIAELTAAVDSAKQKQKDVKDEIKRVCPGSPRVDGQRVIWRGRLLRDEELVMDIWKVCGFVS